MTYELEYIVSIDPGLKSGYMALFHIANGNFELICTESLVGEDGGEFGAEDRLSFVLDNYSHELPRSMVVYEEQIGRPNQSSKATFTAGRGYEIALVLASKGKEVNLVSPKKWKKHFGLTSDKEASLALCAKYLNKTGFCVVNHNEAEAILLGIYQQEIRTRGKANVR